MQPKNTLLAAALCVLFVGCPISHPPVVPTVVQGEPQAPLADLISQTLESNLQNRVLSSEVHGAWQIMHGILAYGDQLVIETSQREQNAIEYIQNGGSIAGFSPQLGDQLGDPPRYGLRMELQRSTKVGQGHHDQWLAVLVQAGLSDDSEVKAGDHVFTVNDWLNQMQYDTPLNFESEFSWSLIALTKLRDTTNTWTTREGTTQSTERLLASELRAELSESVCGGTHRLIGIAMALDKRRQEGAAITGVWADAEAVLAESIATAKANQNADGSFSSAYFHRTGWTRDLGETLGTTGHVLEFLAIAASDETLQQPWVERSVRRICTILNECRDLDLECGVLYHALHGLVIYQERAAKF